MANTRKSMRKIRHVLKLAREAGLTQRQIARSLAMSPTTVGEYLRRAEMAGIAWPLNVWRRHGSGVNWACRWMRGRRSGCARRSVNVKKRTPPGGEPDRYQ